MAASPTTGEKTTVDTAAETPNANWNIDEEYPGGARLAALIASLMLGMFLVALDNVRRLVAFPSCLRSNRAHL